MIRTALFYFPVDFAFNLTHYVTTIARCTTQVKKKESKKEILKIEKIKIKIMVIRSRAPVVTKNWPQGDLKPEPQNH